MPKTREMTPGVSGGDGQDYLAFRKNTEAKVTEDNVGHIADLVLSTRLKNLSTVTDKTDGIFDEIGVIENELAMRRAVSEMTIAELEERLSLLTQFDLNEEHCIREELQKRKNETPTSIAKK